MSEKNCGRDNFKRFFLVSYSNLYCMLLITSSRTSSIMAASNCRMCSRLKRFLFLNDGPCLKYPAQKFWGRSYCGISISFRDYSGLRLPTSGRFPGSLALFSFAANDRPRFTYITGSARALVKKTQEPGIKLQKADFFSNDTWTSPQTNSEDAPKIPLVHFF